jgi:hypothetical protein
MVHSWERPSTDCFWPGDRRVCRGVLHRASDDPLLLRYNASDGW